MYINSHTNFLEANHKCDNNIPGGNLDRIPRVFSLNELVDYVIISLFSKVELKNRKVVDVMC